MRFRTGGSARLDLGCTNVGGEKDDWCLYCVSSRCIQPPSAVSFSLPSRIQIANNPSSLTEHQSGFSQMGQGLSVLTLIKLPLILGSYSGNIIVTLFLSPQGSHLGLFSFRLPLWFSSAQLRRVHGSLVIETCLSQ